MQFRLSLSISVALLMAILVFSLVPPADAAIILSENWDGSDPCVNPPGTWTCTFSSTFTDPSDQDVYGLFDDSPATATILYVIPTGVNEMSIRVLLWNQFGAGADSITDFRVRAPDATDLLGGRLTTTAAGVTSWSDISGDGIGDIIAGVGTIANLRYDVRLSGATFVADLYSCGSTAFNCGSTGYTFRRTTTNTLDCTTSPCPFSSVTRLRFSHSNARQVRIDDAQVIYALYGGGAWNPDVPQPGSGQQPWFPLKVDKKGCQALNLTFNRPIPGQYVWDWGDGSQSVTYGTNASHTYIGAYKGPVKLTVNALGGEVLKYSADVDMGSDRCLSREFLQQYAPLFIIPPALLGTAAFVIPPARRLGILLLAMAAFTTGYIFLLA